jgi:hypothetical protein
MDRITTEKRDGSDELAGSCEAISSGPPGSNRVIQFPRSSAATIAGDQEDAGVSSASASSTFIPLGVPALAVVMRIKQGLPKISMPPRLREEEEPTSAADQSAGDLG